MPPGYHPSDWSQPGDSKTIRDLLYSLFAESALCPKCSNHIKFLGCFFEIKPIKWTCAVKNFNMTFFDKTGRFTLSTSQPSLTNKDLKESPINVS